MSFDEGDRAIIKEIAYEAATHIAEKLQASVMSGLHNKVEMHVLECPLRAEIKFVKDEIEIAKSKAQMAWKMVVLEAVVLSALATLAIAVWKH